MSIDRDAYKMLLGRQGSGKRAKKKDNPEYHLQCWLALYLSDLHVLFCANSGAGLKLTMGQAVKTKRMGYRKGFPDMQILEPRGKYHGMLIELKCGKGKYPSLEQKAWRDALKDKGYYAVIVPPLEYLDAQNWLKIEIEEYLKLK